MYREGTAVPSAGLFCSARKFRDFNADIRLCKREEICLDIELVPVKFMERGRKVLWCVPFKEHDFKNTCTCLLSILIK